MSEHEQPGLPAIDKSTWGEGPWQHEPDRVDFIHAGLACFARRSETGGQWCGYVGVPSDHPAYGKEYGDIPVGVHGGLTYADRCSGAICHVPEPGMPDDVWWCGFDCAHAGDLAPGYASMKRSFLPPRDTEMFRDVYRALPYVKREIELLAEQLADMGGAA